MGEILKISDILSNYPRQWVTVNITQRDGSGWPVQGRVVLHSKRKDDIVNKIQDIDGDLYLYLHG